MALITNLLMFQPIDNLLMKIVNKIFYFFLITVFLFFVSCSKRGCTDPSSLAFDIEASKDDGSCTYPENSKKTLVFNSTGTWCQHCGEWGKNFSDNLLNNFQNVQIITLHNNDNFSVDIGSFIQSYLDSIHGPKGEPHFYVGTSDVPNNYNQLDSAVSADLLLNPEVNMDLNFMITDGKMNINVHSKLSDEFSGNNCYLATYILEDGRVFEQNILGIYDSNYVHNNILRSEASGLGSAFGVPIIFNSAGDNIKSYSDVVLEPSSLWNYDNLYVVAVIWQQNGTDYRFVNLVR
jgi:hypothetical protein